MTVIVEGNLDVVSSHQAGVANVVATAGTAMTEQHLKALSRLAGRIKLAFDGDKAGVSATERAIGLAQAVGVELEVISLPGDAKDPDELIQTHGVNAWRQAIAEALPAVEWVIRRYSEREDVTSAEGKRRFSTAALTLIRGLKDPVEQEHYLKEVAGVTGASLTALRAKLQGQASQPLSPRLKQPKIEKQAAQQPTDDVEDMVLGLALREPSVRRWLPALKPEVVTSTAVRELLAVLQVGDEMDTERLPSHLQKFEQYVKIVQLKSDSRYANWEPEALDKEMARLVKRMVTKHREHQKQQLLHQLRDAEDMNDEVRAKALRQTLNALIKEKK